MATRKMTRVEPEEITEETAPVTEKPKKKKFANDDLIPCKSITNGELIMVGDKTKIVYRWANYGDVEEVEYQDLIYATRSSRTSYVKYPRFIILDDDFVKQNKEVAEIYDSIYSVADIRKILDLSPAQMKKAIEELPEGAKDSLKGLASTMIDNGTLDSVKKIQILDEVFGTELLLALANN